MLIDVVLPMYNLIEYSSDYLKTSGSLLQYCRDETILNDNGNVIDFPSDNNNSISFKFKHQITGQTGNNGVRDVEIKVPLNHLNNFWGTLEILLINYEISLILALVKKLCFSRWYCSKSGNRHLQ